MIGEQLFINIMLKLLGNEQVRKEIQGVIGDVSKLTKTVDANTNSSKKNTTQVDKATKALAKEGKVVKELPKEWTTVNMVMGKHNKILKEMQVRGAMVNGVMTKQSRTMIGAAAAGKVQSTSMNSLLSSFTKMRWAMVNVALAVMTLKTIYNAVIKPITDLETEMATVRKRTKMSADETKALSQEYVHLSRSVPASAAELAKLGGTAGQLGIRGSENILEFSRVINMMGEATVLTADEAALSLAKISKAYGLPISQIENLGSAINELSNTTAANSKEISEAMLKMGPAANQLGVTAQASAAIGATLVDMGMKASRAGTRMKSVFTRLATQATDIAEIFGDRLPSEVQKGISEDATGSFLELLSKINEAESSTDRVTMATKVFGRVGASAVLGLASNYVDLERNIIRATDEFQKATSLQREYDIQMETSTNQLSIWFGNIGTGFSNMFRAGHSGFGQMMSDTNQATIAVRRLNDVTVEMNDMNPFEEFRFRMSESPLTTGVRDMQLKISAAKKLAEKSKDLEDFISKRGQLGMFENLAEVTPERRVEYEFLYTFATEGYREAMNVVDTALEKEQEKKRIVLSEDEATEVAKNLSDLRVKFHNIDMSNIVEKTEAEYDLLRAEKNLEQYGTIMSDNIKDQATSMSNLELGIGQYEEAISELSTSTEDYTAALNDLQEEAVNLNWTNEEYLAGLKELKVDYADVIRLEEIRKLSINDVKDATEQAADAQKAASYVYSFVNKQYAEQIKSLQELYTQYSKAKFKGEQDELDNIHALEVAIKKEKLEQLKLGEAVEETNDAYKDNEFEAWVTTIENFISAALKEGDLLGKNVSAAIGGFQAKLLSTSKFDEDSGSEAELTALEELEKEREIAQLEYEIGMGEQHYQLEQYINELEHEEDVVFRNAKTAFNAIESKKEKMDELMRKQDKLTQKWEDEQHAIKMNEFVLAGVVDASMLKLGEEENSVDDLIDKYVDLYNAKVKAGSGGTGGGGSSSNTYSRGNYTITDTANYRPGSYKVNKADGSSVYRTHKEYAKGGLIDKPTMALMGEAGPEMVVPLTGPNAGNGLNAITINSVNISGVEGDASSFAAAFSRQLRRELRTV